MSDAGTRTPTLRGGRHRFRTPVTSGSGRLNQPFRSPLIRAGTSGSLRATPDSPLVPSGSSLATSSAFVVDRTLPCRRLASGSSSSVDSPVISGNVRKRRTLGSCRSVSGGASAGSSATTVPDSTPTDPGLEDLAESGENSSGVPAAAGDVSSSDLTSSDSTPRTTPAGSGFVSDADGDTRGQPPVPGPCAVASASDRHRADSVRKRPFRPPSRTTVDRSETAEDQAARLAQLDAEIAQLEAAGCCATDLPRYIDALHRYNEAKDAAQLVMGRLAQLDGVTVRTVHQRYHVLPESERN